MTDDEQFAESLRARVTRVAPRIDVDVTRVVPAARRRRAARAGGVTLALALALAGGAWVATTLEPLGSALPGGADSIVASPSPTPTGPPRKLNGDELPDEPTNPAASPLEPPEGWREAMYMRVVTRGKVEKTGEEGPDVTYGSERWYGEGVSFERTAHGPALLDIYTFLNFGHTPTTHVSFTWAELAELPTEPEALRDALRVAYEPTGQGDDAVLEVTANLLTEAPSPPALRLAAWELLTSLPGVDVEQDVQDMEGRTGTAASFTVFDKSNTVVFDEQAGVVLQDEGRIGKMHTVRRYLATELVPLPEKVADSAIEIPDLTAMTREDVEVVCLQKHLTCTFTEEKSDTAPEGTVISSDPPEGSLVIWGAAITIVLSTGP